VYVDKVLHEILQQQEDFGGTIMLDWGRKFQIAGVIDCDITGEGDKGVHLAGSGYRRMQGTIFAVSRCEGYYYYKIKDGADIKKVKADIEAIFRQYVPETVDVYIPTVAEVVYENEKPVMMLRHLMYLLTFISLLVMVLSVYSSISLDATTRQKEIAIRKINGARSRDIVMQFLRPYVLTYMITFVVIYFSLTNFLPEYLVGSEHNTLLPLLLKVVWGIGIFVVSVGLLAITTWTKIKMIMKVNPADVVRKE
jgi:ABC-type antimicrobial peptide transport system permease subunit